MKLFNRFKKKKDNWIKVFDVSSRNPTGALALYLEHLKTLPGLRNNQFKWELEINDIGMKRFVVYIDWNNPMTIQFFRDRCPAIIELEMDKIYQEYLKKQNKEASQ